MNNCDTVQCFEHKWNIWHAAYIQHFPYQYLNKCFLRCIHTLWNCSHAVGRCNFKRSDSWQAATVMNFSSRRVDWLKSGGGGAMGSVFLRMATGTWHRYLIAETGEWSCQGVTYELITFGLGNAWEWACGKIKLRSNSFELQQENVLLNIYLRVPETRLLLSWRSPHWIHMELHPDQIFFIFRTFASPFHHIILQGSQDLRH